MSSHFTDLDDESSPRVETDATLQQPTTTSIQHVHVNNVYTTCATTTSLSLTVHPVSGYHVMNNCAENFTYTCDLERPPSPKKMCMKNDQTVNSLREPSASNLCHLPQISAQTFGLLYDTLINVQVKWYNIGLALGVLYSTLDGIQESEHYKTEKCLRKMLQNRIETKELTWKEIVVALRKSSVNENDLAQKIESGKLMYFQGVQTVLNELTGDPTLQEMCALSVDKVWHQLGIWLGVGDIIANKEKQLWPSNKKEWIFTSFLNLPKGTKQFKSILDALPRSIKDRAELLMEQARIDESIQTIVDGIKTELNESKDLERIKHLENILPKVNEVFHKRKEPKCPMLITAVVNVGEKKVAEKFCSRKGVSLTSYLDKTDPASNPPKCVLRYAEFLKGTYKGMSVLPDPDWPPAMATKDHYTNLAIIERERDPYSGDYEIAARDYAHGNVDKIFGEKKPIDLEETFLPVVDFKNKRGLTILMDGAPGVGKTTITRKLCIDWANGDILNEYCLVILVSLRELKLSQKEVIETDVINFLVGDDINLKSGVTDYLKKFSGSKVLFIFDGFDELSTEQRKLEGNSLFVKMIKGATLCRSSILVTSRPYASKSLRDFKRINRHVEVLGFTGKQINDCVCQNLTEENSLKLLQSLRERLDIKSLCYIPLNCRIVLFVYKRNNNELPETLTQLYEIFILHTLKHFANRIQEFVGEISEIYHYRDLPSSVKQQVHNLSKMAFEGMQDDKLVFTVEELKEKSYLSLGLLTSLFVFTKTSDIKYFQFLHLTLQEFLAAMYLSSGEMSKEQIISFLHDNIWADRFRMTLLFLVGLTKLNFLPIDKPLLNVSNDLIVELKKQPSKVLFVLQLLYESGNDTFRVLPFLDAKLDMSQYILSQFDLHVLLHALSHTPKNYIWDKILLGYLSSNDCTLFFKKHTENCDFLAIGMTKTLILSDFYVDVKMDCVINILSQPKIFEVHFPELDCSDVQTGCTLSTKLCKVMADHPTLHFLSFGRYNKTKTLSKAKVTPNRIIPLCSKGFCYLVKFLNDDQLTELSLPGYKNAFQDCTKCGGSGELAKKELYELICRSQKLKRLNLNKCCLPDNLMKNIMTMQASNSVKVQRNSFMYGSFFQKVQTWASGKKASCLHLDKVKLKCGSSIRSEVEIELGTPFDHHLISVLNEVLEAMKICSLFVHKLTIGRLVEALTSIVCPILEESVTLHTLVVHEINDERTLIKIFKSIQQNCSLRNLILYLHYYRTPHKFQNDCSKYITAYMTTAFLEVIVHSKTITTIKVNQNLLNCPDESVAKCLLQNSTLKYFYVSGNRVENLKEEIKKQDIVCNKQSNLNIDIQKWYTCTT